MSTWAHSYPACGQPCRAQLRHVAAGGPGADRPGQCSVWRGSAECATVLWLAPSSSGPGRRPLKAVAPVQIRSGLLTEVAGQGPDRCAQRSVLDHLSLVLSSNRTRPDPGADVAMLARPRRPRPPGRLPWLAEQPQLAGPGGRLGAVGRAEFVEDVADVLLDRADSHHQLPGDL